MDEFELKGQDGFIKIQIIELFDFPERISCFGGYDCIVSIEIIAFPFNAKSKFYTTTGELFEFYQKLKKCHTDLNGSAVFDSYEENLNLTVKYVFGKVKVYGKFQENLASDNKLIFELNSDQSYLSSSMIQLEKITEKYGGMQGIEKVKK